MNKNEYLENINRMIKNLVKNNYDNEIKVLKEMVDFRTSHSTPELESLRDIFYFLCGIMFVKGLSDYWNGREVSK